MFVIIILFVKQQYLLIQLIEHGIDKYNVKGELKNNNN